MTAYDDGVHYSDEEDPADDESFAYDLFLACVSGLVARGVDALEVYADAKALAQRVYDDATADNKFHEVMNQTWPTKFS